MSNSTKKMGFWQVWGMSVGVVIGSGIFLLPTVLAPYGAISLLGWLTTSIGAILLALILSRLAGRTDRSGGPYVYAQEAFGDLTGFLIAWGYWLSVVFALAAVSAAFAGYLGSMIPVLASSNLVQGLVAAAAIWVLVGINLRGVGEAAAIQLVLAVLKLMPLFAIILLALFAGDTANMPEFNPQKMSPLGAIAATALLTMWAFSGIEAGVIAAKDVEDPKRTIPRAIIAASLSVAALYMAVTVSIMLLVPNEQLLVSQAPFVDAAQKLGPWGGALIAFGALVSTAGGLNGNIFVSGQMPMAVAIDKLAPQRLALKNAGGSPGFSLVVSAIFGTILLALNFTEGLVSAFTFLISMSTLAVLTTYGVSALAELKHSYKNAKAWVLLSLVSFAYTILAAAGSGLTVLAWGLVLFIVGTGVYFWFKKTVKAQT